MCFTFVPSVVNFLFKETCFIILYVCTATAILHRPGNTNSSGRLSTVDLLSKVVFFVKNDEIFFRRKSSWSELVSELRSMVPDPSPLERVPRPDPS